MVPIACFTRLPVGLLTWNAPEPAWTFVVKSTFQLVDGLAPLAEQQEPLSLDDPDPIGDGSELRRCSDFAPFKPYADVLLTGVARAAAPAQMIPVRLATLGIERRVFALAGSPSVAVPLVQSYLRTTPSERSAAARVGPRSLATGASASLVSREGVLEQPLTRAFDFSVFNVAPPEQQVESLGDGISLVIEGAAASSQGAPITVRLPNRHPVLFAARSPTDEKAWEIPLVCDTLLIDTELDVCTVSWRGVFPRPDGLSFSYALAMHEGANRITWPVLRARMGKAKWAEPTVPSKLLRALHPPPASGIELSTQHKPGAPLRNISLRSTQLPSLSTPASSPLPFTQAPQAPQAPPAPRSGDPLLGVPFKPSTPAPRVNHDDDENTAVGPLRRSTALPFESQSTPRPAEQRSPSPTQPHGLNPFHGLPFFNPASARAPTAAPSFTPTDDPLIKDEQTLTAQTIHVPNRTAEAPRRTTARVDDETTATFELPEAPLDPLTRSSQVGDAPTFWRQIANGMSGAPEPTPDRSNRSLVGLPFFGATPPALAPGLGFALGGAGRAVVDEMTVTLTPPAPAEQPAAPLPRPASSIVMPVAFAEEIHERVDPQAKSAVLGMEPAVSPSVIERYAAVKAAFWGKESPRAAMEDVLRELGVDEDTFRAEEQHLLAALADEAKEGRASLSRAVRAAMKRAQRAAAPAPTGPIVRTTDKRDASPWG